MADLRGKIAIVTGANSGMGLSTVEALSDKGASVIMLCRNEERGRAAIAKLTEEKERNLDLIICDLGDYASIRNFVRCVKGKYPRVDILVNNAGFISLDRQETKEGMERQFGVNYLGHFLLTIQLLDLMDSGSRIVNVASGAHKVGKIHFDDINLRKGYNVVKAYSQSKLANVLFTRELARRLKERRITVNCCHPGAVATNIGIDRETGFGKTVTGMLKPFFQTPAEGAETAVYLAADPSVRNVTGGYFYRCKPAKSSKRSKNRKLAKRLFEFSKELITNKIKCIRSGGQTGVDRAALDTARKFQIEICGWCPKGGWAEDLPSPPGLLTEYPELQETPSAGTSQRTRWNMRDADAILTIMPENSGESKGTMVGLQEGILLQKPMYTARGPEDIPGIEAWLDTLPDELDLCVGGPRASECPEAYQITMEILSAVLQRFL